jgi:acetoacetate decarboxylase
MHVGIDACLVGVECVPVDVADMMFGKKHRPLGHAQNTSSLAQPSLLIDVPFPMRSSEDIRPSIYRIGEHAMDGVVSRGDPTDLALHIRS